MSSPGVALRPGIAGGAYPEKVEDKETRLQRSLRVAGRRLANGFSSPRAQLEAFVRRVHEYDHLAKTGDAALQARVTQLRGRLLKDGLLDEALPECFALVREAARRTLGMAHYDVQLMGGYVMARGMLAEMETGEGKTLTATLPACAAALAGIPVHVFSSNDYLVARDAEGMRPLYEWLGLSVSAVTEADREPDSRRRAYACDVTYGTTKQIAFDYLRDGLALGRDRGRLQLRLERLYRETPRAQKLLLRGLCFAVVDEADAVLIDEGRTPLILAAPSNSPEQVRTYKQALRLAKALEQGEHYALSPGRGTLELREAGRDRLAELAQPLGGAWSGGRRREEFVMQALRALHLFERDKHYLVRDGAVEIIDQPTGRANADRSWERGLHQMIELKERCEPTPERETLARISYQRFFSRYLRLSGMTGTAREVSAEMFRVYGLDARPIPTRKPSRRHDAGTRVFRYQDEKDQALAETVARLHRDGRPVLVGTCSLAESERVSRLLEAAGLPHTVLNARQDAEEADIVAEAGQAGRITVATSMAGRGTDISLGPGVADAGGLHVLATQRAEAGRIDRQLYGRCARQGDPGSFEAILSLEDEAMVKNLPAWLLRLARGLGREDTPLPGSVGRWLTSLPQKSEESRHARARRAMSELEAYSSDLLAFSGVGE